MFINFVLSLRLRNKTATFFTDYSNSAKFMHRFLPICRFFWVLYSHNYLLTFQLMYFFVSHPWLTVSFKRKLFSVLSLKAGSSTPSFWVMGGDLWLLSEPPFSIGHGLVLLHYFVGFVFPSLVLNFITPPSFSCCWRECRTNNWFYHYQKLKCHNNFKTC